ncbi:putative NIF3 family GTP cyclohydrolase 1 type 2 [Fictibacillus halophilus]|uniref:GTP cyclohydrolase 1 type 2 homolog n=1 Tax=Fictibacillus halophilus TaxID=1610490 RepID=A0ABV2LP31_9BACL|nr:Nif3-like dinuclear metal center hexameric protein [Fictibacillus halophilus]
MKTSDFEKLMTQLFGKWLKEFEDEGEYGFTHKGKKEINVIAYATNLTPETVEKAHSRGADMLITHHDAWDFVYGMKEGCVDELKKHNITHYFTHYPLDFVEFGTSTALFERIEIDEITTLSTFKDNEEIPGIGIFHTPRSFTELKEQLEHVMGETVQAWKNHDRPIKKVGILTGAGNHTAIIQYAQKQNCDAYITGERTLYSVQYAKFAGINLYVGSHTFTEIFGVENLVLRIQEFYPEVKVVNIEEDHIESGKF